MKSNFYVDFRCVRWQSISAISAAPLAAFEEISGGFDALLRLAAVGARPDAASFAAEPKAKRGALIAFGTSAVALAAAGIADTAAQSLPSVRSGASDLGSVAFARYEELDADEELDAVVGL